MPDLHFDVLFAIAVQEMPEIKMATEFEDYFAWTERYQNSDFAAFMNSLGMAILAVGQFEGRTAPSYCVSSLNPVSVRRNFEERLHRCQTMPNLGYTEYDTELIAEYFRLNPPPALPPKLTIVTSDT